MARRALFLIEFNTGSLSFAGSPAALFGWSVPVLAGSSVIEPGVTGTLVPRDDAESMARAMRAYVESAELCRRQGSEARRTVERRFGMQAMVNAYMAVYDNMLASPTRRVQS